MANNIQLNIILRGPAAWNRWRTENPDVVIDLSGADLSERDLRGIDLHHANLRQVRFNMSNMPLARLDNADLSDADLASVYMLHADLRSANLERAHLHTATMSGAKLSHANLRDTVLMCANLVESDLSFATLVNSRIYGVSAWNVKLEGTIQQDLMIHDYGEYPLTVGDLEVAQFIYLILKNERLRHVIDTVTSKVVLILGRFTPDRKQILDDIRDALREPPFDYVPVMFDFTVPTSKGYIETVSTLANMARFVIADVTDAKVILEELHHVVPNHPSVPVQPIILAGSDRNVMLNDFVRYPWFLPLYEYPDGVNVGDKLADRVIRPAEEMVKEQRTPRSL